MGEDVGGVWVFCSACFIGGGLRGVVAFDFVSFFVWWYERRHWLKPEQISDETYVQGLAKSQTMKNWELTT